MHRFAARTLTVVSLAGLLAAGSLPAGAKPSGSKHHGGKKLIGEIVSFDAATSVLVVDLTGGETVTAPVAPDAQVKLEQRGWAKKDSRGDGNPTRGSLDDLLPGASVLRLKLEDDTVTKIRLRVARAETPAPTETPIPAAGEELDSDDSQDAEDDPDEAEDDSDDDENPDDSESGDPEEALPPLPTP